MSAASRKQRGRSFQTKKKPFCYARLILYLYQVSLRFWFCIAPIFRLILLNTFIQFETHSWAHFFVKSYDSRHNTMIAMKLLTSIKSKYSSMGNKKNKI